MEIFAEFWKTYGMTILSSLLTTVCGYLGIAAKNLYQKYMNDRTKREVVRTCVQAVEQLWKDLHGDEKYRKAMDSAREMLSEKGISISDVELNMLIEAAVGEFNRVFGSEEKLITQDP